VLKAPPEIAPLERPVRESMRPPGLLLPRHLSCGQALDLIRERAPADAIYYFYVIDEHEALCGVLPVRSLLTSPLERPLEEILVARVISVPDTARVLDACELFAMHKLLALPVVDSARRVQGLLDVNLFTEGVFDVAERERMDEVFEAIGVRVSQVQGQSPVLAFRYRFPWLLPTLASGLACAVLTGWFGSTLERSLALAFFLTLVLGLGESVAIQTMTLTVQTLRHRRPTLRWYLREWLREAISAGLLGLACGALVGPLTLLWQAPPAVALSVALAIALAVTLAGLHGLSVPALLHALRLDPRIAAGPLTLALTDLSTLLLFFSTARLLIG